MKIIEVRDGFILLEADESVYLSSFVRVLGMGKDYIAQINRLQRVNNIVIATAKILFVMMNDELFNYDKTEPMRDAEVVPFTMNILQNSIKVNKPVILGKTYDDSGYITVDYSAFDKKMLISVSKSETNNILMSNFVKQFANLGKKTVIIDTNNSVTSFKYIAGKDFKLPLNKTTLQFLYKSCLDEATPDSKPLIADVFADLSEYAQTVPFVPFGVLKSIVDELVDKQHLLKLFVLKNRLDFLQRYGYFADKQSEVESLNKILVAPNVVIDISKTGSQFMNYYIEYIYSLLNPSDTQVMLETSNAVSKRNLKMIITESDVSTTMVVNPKYRYLADLKGLFDNFIIEPSEENNTTFSIYKSFLSSMPEDTCLLAGEAINYIPMITKVQDIDEVSVIKETVEQEEAEVSQNISDEDYNADEIAETENEEDTETEIEIDEESDDIVGKTPAQAEILANIEQKSEEVINSVSENLEDMQEIDLFDSENPAEEEMAEQLIEDIIEPDRQEEAETPNEETEDIIEPEYTELPSEQEELKDDINEVSPEELQGEDVTEQEDFGEITETENVELLEGLSDDLSEDNQISDETGMETLEELDDLNDDLSGDISVLEESSVDIDENNDEISLEADEEILNEDLVTDELPAVSESTVELSEENDVNDNTVLQDFSEEDNSIEDFDEIIELDDDADPNDIIIDLTDEDEDKTTVDEDLDRQIVEEVDKVYTTIKENDEPEEISDSDLDLIDELNGDGDDGMLEEYSGSIDEGILEQPSESIIPEKEPQPDNHEILEKRDSNTPIVPVYDADIPQEDMVVSDPIQQGDSVVHAKYGNGIVEKMIKYGTKTLFSINFENIGRRLLDPTLTEIKKL